jgi:hypothetical protein
MPGLRPVIPLVSNHESLGSAFSFNEYMTLKQEHIMIPRLTALALALVSAQVLSAPTPFSSFQGPVSSWSTYPGRATGQFFVGNDDQGAGFIDGMLPLISRPEQFLFFADGTMIWGQHHRSVYSSGLGARGIINSWFGPSIVGAYIQI